MKIMKRLFIGLVIFIIVLLAAAFILPVVFKDSIKAEIDKQIAKNVNADVIFDVNNFSLSIFSNFPSITAEIKELGVFNRAPFEGEHLFVVQQLDVELNLMDVLFGSQTRIKGITLVKPQINVKVMADGRANYDIAIPSTETPQPEEAPSTFSVGIDHWEIVDGELLYDDKSIPYSLILKGLNHTGNGDFTQDVFDLRTHTIADSVSTGMGEMTFLKNKRAEIDAVISISENISKFTFKQNTAKINDFGMSFDGWFKMNPDNYEMDITFKSPENTFKSLLSLVPGIYTRDFKGIETSGDLSFDGFVKGKYNEKQMPAFNLGLKVKEGMFKYPDLPTAVNHINMDLLVDNKDGVISNTMVDLKTLHLDFGKNPVDAKLKIENLRNYRLEGNLKAKLNLAELNKMFPMKDTEMSGIFSLDASAKGVYDTLKKIIPASGTLALSDFAYRTKGMPPFTIKRTQASFDPKKIELKEMEGTIGKSDFKVTGLVNNYLGYVMKQETIKGTVTYTANLLDLNEFMTSDGSTATKDTSKLSVIPIPKNIDFEFKSKINTVQIMDHKMTQAGGDIILKDGIANLSGLRFNMLGGAFVVNGSYNTSDLKHPKYDFNLGISNVDIQQAAHSFSIIKTYAPIAGQVKGNFSTDFKINGELLPDMMPDMKTVNGGGLVKTAQATLTQSKTLANIMSMINLGNSNEANFKDLSMLATINNGRLSVKPFDVKLGSYSTTVAGSTGLDGSIDYSLKTMVPAGQAGAQLQGFINQYTGSKKPTDKIPVTIGLGGTYNNPSTKLMTSEQTAELKAAATKAAEEKGKEALKEISKGAKPEDVVKDILGGTPKKDTTKKDSTAVPKVDPIQDRLQNLLKKKKP